MSQNGYDHGPDAGDEMQLGELLRRERPRPSAGFVEDLRRQLSRRDPGPRPQRLRVLIAGYAAAGMLLLALGTAGAGGAIALGI